MQPDNAAQPQGEMSEEDKMAAEWAAALAESTPSSAATEVQTQAEQVAPASFTNFASGTSPTAGNDINMILDIPVQLTVELGRTRIPIKHILQLAQGEVVVVNDKFGIRLTDIVTPSERMRRLSRG